MRSNVLMLGAILLVTALTGCTSHGVPAHGGGKRFYWEQELLANATDEALRGLQSQQIAQLSGKNVVLALHVMGDEGGGTQSGAASFFGFGGSSMPMPGVGDAAPMTLSSPDGATYGSYAFANARDIEYLKGRIMFALAAANVSIATSDTHANGTLHVLVSTFGTDKASKGMFLYRKEKLNAMVRIALMYDEVGETSRPVLMGEGVGRALFSESYFFGVTIDEPGITLERKG